MDIAKVFRKRKSGDSDNNQGASGISETQAKQQSSAEGEYRVVARKKQ